MDAQARNTGGTPTISFSAAPSPFGGWAGLVLQDGHTAARTATSYFTEADAEMAAERLWNALAAYSESAV